MSDLGPKLFAGACCLAMWAPVAALAGYGAHRRMLSVERKDGIRAEPPHETPLLIYAVASIAWPFAFVLMCVGLLARKWVRLGRGGTFLLLGHFTVAVLGSLVTVMMSDRGNREALPIVIQACLMVAAGATAFAVMTWRWAGARAARIAAGPITGAPLGAARFGIYAAAALVPFAGLLAPFLLPEPQHAHVAKTTARISALGLTAIALAVCVGLTLAVHLLEKVD